MNKNIYNGIQFLDILKKSQSLDIEILKAELPEFNCGKEYYQIDVRIERSQGKHNCFYFNQPFRVQ